jgi:transketolase
MRNAFCRALVDAASRDNFVFLTGDLGFSALEPLREALGSRFINAGVAEQNMVSVAAGLARSGLRPWVYSIAPFVYARPYEQIRNDVCFHRLPVVMVGNGGGYGYGVMGPTHHGLEDYGSLLGLPHLRAFIPAFDSDISKIIDKMFSISDPAYLRLGISEEPKDANVLPYSAWRKLQDGPGWLIVVTGPLVGGIWGAVRMLEGHVRPTLWLLSELPIQQVVEEHISQGGVAQNLASFLLSAGRIPERFSARNAQGYLSGRYGSQSFHRRECGLDPASILEFLEQGDV